ncbi:unnamed protein product [Cuscuta campestris]|uniref:Uncharacterized protein n=2 Tax=Cuscuta sect. Cleistogrammica TaxID=1824901 RepID=A0A484K436_9ASTE|nr:hypothetical protein DM860_010515 [Cuscuta australis]VFQ59295.1 unnamed protein product [Cuscuta campestris]
MGRGRGKGKKLNHHEDLGSGGEEKKQPVRKRGRPVKPAKEEDDDIENNTKVAEGLEDGGDNAKGDTTILSKDGGDGNAGPTDLKRVAVAGYRQNGSRRKNKPRRAAEVGVECR